MQYAFQGRLRDLHQEEEKVVFFREDELYDLENDEMDSGYRRYDDNDLPLSPPKQPLNIPADYLSLYSLQDARKALPDCDIYHDRCVDIDV